MTLQSFVDQVKRYCRTGTSGDNTDTVATDIVVYLNMRMYQVWRFFPWWWSLVDLTFTLPANTSDYTFPAGVGSLYLVNVQGQDDYLQEVTPKQYRRWKALNAASTPSTQITGTLTGFYHLGFDSNKNLKVRFFATPAAATVIEGWGKGRITTYAVADIPNISDLAYFPDEVQEIIFRLVAADLRRQADDKTWEGDLTEAMSELRRLKGEQASDLADDATSPAPDLIIFGTKKRGGTQVV